LFDSKRPKVSGKTNYELVGNEHRTIKLPAVQQTPDLQSSKEAAAEQTAAGGCRQSQHLKQKDADISILRQQVMFLETKMEQENEQAHKALDFLKETGGLESQYPALMKALKESSPQGV
jgi:small-conductance mechanosensitive channel